MTGVSPEKYRHDLEIVRNTALQIIKDFGMAGVEIVFSNNPATAYNELLQQITPALKQLYIDNPGKFMALLYRIDVEEMKVKKLLKNGAGDGFYASLAELIIEREFIKVLIRKLYGTFNG
jgi:hypothetical protein